MKYFARGSGGSEVILFVRCGSGVMDVYCDCGDDNIFTGTPNPHPGPLPGRERGKMRDPFLKEGVKMNACFAGWVEEFQ